MKTLQLRRILLLFITCLVLLFSCKNEHSSILNLASKAILMEEFDLAIKYYNQIIEQEPKNYHYRLMRADCYYKSKDYENALREYNKLDFINGKVTYHYFNRAEIHILLGEPNFALLNLNVYINDKKNKDNLKYSIAFFYRSMLLHKFGFSESAKKDFVAYLKLSKTLGKMDKESVISLGEMLKFEF